MITKSLPETFWANGALAASLIVAGLALSPTVAAQSSDDDVMEEVVVKGFRSSLRQAVALKRDAVNSRDSIVSEDIGKMPDLNLAEAIQRVPGIAITREGGEGRQITIRGLGPDFTRVTLNGMEVPASTGGLDSFGGVNRGRAFDFNVFSADLFTRIDVNKSPTASIEEGGVSGTVELYTARPLDRPGFHASVFGQAGYNDLSEEADPTFNAFLSTTNDAETFGFLVTAAYTERTVWQDGFGTVRWAVPDQPFAGNNTSLSDAEINSLWYPRLPRQDSFHHTQDRLGLSSALQFRPTDNIEFGLNWVNSQFESTTDSYNSFAEFRRSGVWGYPHITVNSVTLDPTSSYVVAGDFSGVGLRTESRQNTDSTDFNQLTADFEWGISDTLTLKGLVGQAKSEFFDDYFRVNIETPEPGANFSYNFTSDPDVAAISYDIDVADPNSFFIMTNDTIQQYKVDRTNDTVRLDLTWAMTDKHGFDFGAIYNNREVDSEHYLCGTCQDQTDIVGLGKVYNFSDLGGYGSGTELDFWVLDFDRAKAAYGLGDWTIAAGPGRQTWVVEEKTTGAYVDYNLNTVLADRELRLNAGVRYVDTKTTATGWLAADIPNTEENSYDNWLPSVNVAYDITPDLVLRGGVSRTMTRAGLSSLAPIKSYSDVNFTVSGGNSQLDPLVSDNLDLAIEWYFAEQSVVSLAYFQKDIDSFISSPSSDEPLRPEDFAAVAAVYPTQPGLLDPSLIWTYSTAANTEGTKLDGFEISYQQAFTELPGLWSGFGVIANYSYVDATTLVVRSGQDVTVPLEGLSKNSWNATVYYELDRWGVRLAVNNRDDYVTNNTGSNGNLEEATTGPTRYDMSAFFHINDMMTMTLEGINLTDEAERLYTTGDGTLNLVREYNFTGRQLFLGLRVNF
ncbi:MAG: TonB-dependent receptor [Gammaproteobacteria bacterium]